jgi:hypothetical protein
MDAAQRENAVATVLIVAADPNIEALVGELIAFAGHRPIHDVTCGAAGESVRLVHPDIVLLDTALGSAVVAACLAAADETTARVVMISSTDSAGELEAIARRYDVPWFALPGGPAPLASAIELALSQRGQRPPVELPDLRERGVRPAMCAALAGAARADGRLAIAACDDAADSPRTHLRSAHDLERRSRASLRAAVVDYTAHLRAQEIPFERAIVLVKDAVTECANVVAAERAAALLLPNVEQWIRQAYTA